MSIWIEKYRPKTFSEIIGQKEIISRVESMVKQKSMPHLLFAGPAGVGKSTLALVVAKSLYGESWRENFLELNASDDRGIDVVRGIIKDFARVKSMSNVPFKIIFLDECDSLTKDAQQALRRTMENYTVSTRFVLSCNYSSKLIDPIISRCSVFRFKNLEQVAIEELIDNICNKENLKIDDKAKFAIFEVSNGDCRKATNILQSCASISNDIKEELVYNMISAINPKEVKGILETVLSGNFITARDKTLDLMLKKGLTGLDIIKQIQKEIWGLNLDDKRKIELIDKCGEIEFRMVEGSDEFLQLETLLANFMKK
jgi:replication factor C small subunit